jgi:hypothetical protein
MTITEIQFEVGSGRVLGKYLCNLGRWQKEGFMKIADLLLGSSFFALLSLVAGCQRDAPAVAQPPGDVVFARAGVVLTVGPNWKRIDRDPGAPVCPPTLVGEGGQLRAILFDADRSDPEIAANILSATIQAATRASKEAFHREEFAADGGLKGIHLWYELRLEKDAPETRTHNYIFKNREGRCVSVSYIVPSKSESEAVHEMIRKTLKLK